VDEGNKWMTQQLNMIDLKEAAAKDKIASEMAAKMAKLGVPEQEIQNNSTIIALRKGSAERQAAVERSLRTNWNNTTQKQMAEVMTSGSVEKDFKSLPKDKQVLVEDLSKKNASKVSIINQIEQTMSTWDDLPRDQQVAKGRQLLKTLNSTEGADAIGVEEANRLGSKLEFALGNLFNSNPVQVGRDLPGFKEQAQELANSMRKAVDANQKIVDEQFGRKEPSKKMENADNDYSWSIKE
jgi:hypothetical protein